MEQLQGFAGSDPTTPVPLAEPTVARPVLDPESLDPESAAEAEAEAATATTPPKPAPMTRAEERESRRKARDEKRARADAWRPPIMPVAQLRSKHERWMDIYASRRKARTGPRQVRANKAVVDGRKLKTIVDGQEAETVVEGPLLKTLVNNQVVKTEEHGRAVKIVRDGRVLGITRAPAPVPAVPTPSSVFAAVLRKIHAASEANFGGQAAANLTRRVLTMELQSLSRADCDTVIDSLHGYFPRKVQRAAFRNIVAGLHLVCKDELQAQAQGQAPSVPTTTLDAALAQVERYADEGGEVVRSVRPVDAADVVVVTAADLDGDLPPNLQPSHEERDEARLLAKDWRADVVAPVAAAQRQQQRNEPPRRGNRTKGLDARVRHKVNAGREFRQKAEQ